MGISDVGYRNNEYRTSDIGCLHIEYRNIYRAPKYWVIGISGYRKYRISEYLNIGYRISDYRISDIGTLDIGYRNNEYRTWDIGYLNIGYRNTYRNPEYWIIGRTEHRNREISDIGIYEYRISDIWISE